MAITTKPYIVYISQIAQAMHDLYADQLKVALFTSAYTPGYDSDTTYANLTGEVVGAGYDAGGKDILNRGTAVDGTTLTFTVKADPLIWTGLTATIRYAVFYNASKNDGLIGAVDFGEDLTYDNGSFTLDLSSGFAAFQRD